MAPAVSPVRRLAPFSLLAWAVLVGWFALAVAVHSQSASEPVGFGAGTTGGAGGRTVLVTSAADDGPGSLRAAIETPGGPRIVEFGLGGTIALTRRIEIGPDTTVDARSAPSAVTVTGARLRVVGSNVILRGLRVRPGDGPGEDPENRDGISIGRGKTPIRNVLIDGNSISWSIDEAVSVWGEVADVTISNNIIAEALDQSLHPKGRHSMGLLIGGGAARRITVVGNLFAHNRHRNPNVKDQSRSIELINNLVYNWGPNGLQGAGSQIHILGNVYLPGPDTVDRPPLHLQGGGVPGPLFYLNDNRGAVREDADMAGSGALSDGPVFPSSGTPVLPSSQVEAAVLARAGALLPGRDPVDRRILEEVRARSGAIIDSPSQVIGGRNSAPAAVGEPEKEPGTPRH